MNVPLNDRDFAEIRENVMREIARRQRRNAMFLAASVAFAVVAMVFVLLPTKVPERRTPSSAAPRVVAISPRPAAVPADEGVRPSKEVVKHRHHHHRKPAPPIAIASSEQQQPITIELQTANPDVRIIWIARQETK